MSGPIAVREGERLGNRPNRWHLVTTDTGVGSLVTVCGRVIGRAMAFEATPESIEREGETGRVRRCKRCWK